MMSLRATKSSCFLCLQLPPPTPASSHNDLPQELQGNIKQEVEEDQPLPLDRGLQSVSLTAIGRYLQLKNPALTVTMEGNRISEIIKKDFVPLSVFMCQDCARVATKLSDLCEQLQLLQMQVDHTLEQFYSKMMMMEEGDIDEDVLSWNDNETQLEDATIRIFRRKTIDKCKNRLSRNKSTRRPIVKVKKMGSPTKKVCISNPSSPLTLEQFPVLHVKAEKSALLVEGWTDHNYNVGEIVDEDVSFESSQQPTNSLLQPPPPPPPSRMPMFTDKISEISCNVCPNRPKFRASHHLTIHQQSFHLDYVFASSRQPHISSVQFKDYCDHVLHIEGLVNKRRPEVVTAHSSPHDEIIRLYGCQYCDVGQFTTWRHLRRHLCNHHMDILSKKLAELQQSTSPEELKLVLLPPLRDGSKCKDCGATFAQANSLVRHRKKSCTFRADKNVTLKRPCKCPECGKKFLHTSTFHRHRHMNHVTMVGLAPIIL